MSSLPDNLEDIIEWDVRNWARCLTYWAQHSKVDFETATALEIGSRNGGISLWLAQQGAEVICSDVHGPSDLALEKHQRHKIQQRIAYANINALQIPFEQELDIVAFKSVLGALEEHGGPGAHLVAIQQIYDSLKPGGQLLFAENLLASPLHQVLRKCAVKWAAEWHYPTLNELLSWLSPFSSYQFGTAGFLGALGRSERQRGWLAGMDSLLLERCVPKSWNYIVFGVATK